MSVFFIVLTIALELFMIRFFIKQIKRYDLKIKQWEEVKKLYEKETYESNGIYQQG
ncbi:hypothetical protein [Bacillus multifaciens]|uniref:hypothetical protein n=1 Tax=Bacillus multifaciens TaxID=3068506 RepID=UPI002741D202|nr:hypothetical protein [Bacillus sp. WLY-B-L8]MDP7980476.1 hypothetical protein [Bacillus sp. WLY-B-L8]